MVSELLNAYRLRSTLGRLPFFVGVLVLVLAQNIIGLVAEIVFYPDPDRDNPTFWLALDFAATLMVLPLAIARLRDIGWHPVTSLFLFIPLAVNPELVSALSPDSGGSVPVPGWMLLLAPIVSIVFLFFALTLFFWKGRGSASA